MKKIQSTDFSVSVIIPNFNGKALLEKNIPIFLKAKNFTQNKIKEIIIIDDGSLDNSAKFVKENYPEIELIKHTKNRGFSASVNTGVRMAKGDLIALLNTDVLPKEDFLLSIIPQFEDKSVFAVSMHEKNYTWAKGRFKDGYIQIEPGEETDETHISFWVSGGSGVFRKSMWKELGGMDEKLLSPFYWEDIDICYRGAKRGWKILWDPDSHVEHKHESTIGKMPKKYVDKIRERNQLLFTWKNVQSPGLMRKHLAGVIKRLVKHPGYIKVLLMTLPRLKQMLKLRAKEKKESKVSDEIIFSRFK
ncbi:MAG: glycosyltransferase [bacterium]|nr:glycosyltransferase [bacterium]